jgi:hypothetical protein
LFIPIELPQYSSLQNAKTLPPQMPNIWHEKRKKNPMHRHHSECMVTTQNLLRQQDTKQFAATGVQKPLHAFLIPSHGTGSMATAQLFAKRNHETVNNSQLLEAHNWLLLLSIPSHGLGSSHDNTTLSRQFTATGV